MSKQKDLKRKMQLEEKAKYQSLCFQVSYGKEKLMSNLLSVWSMSSDTKNIQKIEDIVKLELEVARQTGIAKDLLLLKDMVEDVRNKLGFAPEMCIRSLVLSNSMIPYFIGIVPFEPTLSAVLVTENPLASLTQNDLPLQIQIYYDNEIRNQVVDWLKAKYDKQAAGGIQAPVSFSTRLGQPVIKLSNMVIEVRRSVKDI